MLFEKFKKTPLLLVSGAIGFVSFTAFGGLVSFVIYSVLFFIRRNNDKIEEKNGEKKIKEIKNIIFNMNKIPFAIFFKNFLKFHAKNKNITASEFLNNDFYKFIIIKMKQLLELKNDSQILEKNLADKNIAGKAVMKFDSSENEYQFIEEGLKNKDYMEYGSFFKSF